MMPVNNRFGSRSLLAIVFGLSATLFPLTTRAERRTVSVEIEYGESKESLTLAQNPPTDPDVLHYGLKGLEAKMIIAVVEENSRMVSSMETKVVPNNTDLGFDLIPGSSERTIYPVVVRRPRQGSPILEINASYALVAPLPLMPQQFSLEHVSGSWEDRTAVYNVVRNGNRNSGYLFPERFGDFLRVSLAGFFGPQNMIAIPALSMENRVALPDGVPTQFQLIDAQTAIITRPKLNLLFKQFPVNVRPLSNTQPSQ